MRKIAILGSTGSIGSSAIALIAGDLKGEFEVAALSFHNNAELALKQALLVGARRVIATSLEGFREFKKLYQGQEIEVLYGDEALVEVCQNPNINVILLAIVGVRALEFALNSILADEERILAIANKEAIICGFHLLKAKLEGSKTRLIPVDSEHNSLFRLLSGLAPTQVKKAFITASGGPFFGQEFESLTNASIEQVVKHPVWNMGRKISVDSATMANKGLELIEAYKLFGFQKGQVEAFVVKGSLLHAGVFLKDGSSEWFLSKPDMKNHISHAICGGLVKELDLPEIDLLTMKSVEFLEIKPSEFPLFFIAKTVAENASIQEAISFNVLNELAVEKFLKGKIKYTEILAIVEKNLTYNPLSFKFESLQEIEEYVQLLKRKIG